MNIDDLKKPIPALDYDDSPYLSGLNEGQAIGWNEAIDYLASRGYLPSVQRIDGLDGAIENLENNVCGRGHLNDYDDNSLDIVIKASRAYLELQNTAPTPAPTEIDLEKFATEIMDKYLVGNCEHLQFGDGVVLALREIAATGRLR